MSIQDNILQKLTKAFHPVAIEVLNESRGHSVSPAGESHFKVVLVSPDFQGKSLVRRHQAVYESLQEELADAVHALALHLYTPEEWAQKTSQNIGAAPSPACAGGSKSEHE